MLLDNYLIVSHFVEEYGIVLSCIPIATLLSRFLVALGVAKGELGHYVQADSDYHIE